MKAIIFDTETTGIDNPEIIEAAWIPFEIGDGMETGYHSEFHQRYKPSGTISWGAMAVHHIHHDDLVTEKLKSSDFALPSRVEYLIGHNVDFDWKAAGRYKVCASRGGQTPRCKTADVVVGKVTTVAVGLD